MADSEIYAVDFDGTLCEMGYPDIGPPIQEVIDYVKELASNGSRLILWTCRSGDLLQKAVDWCTGQGIEFDAINENLEDRIKQYGGDTRKVSASFYIDDKAITAESITNGQVVQKMSEKKFKQMWDLRQAADEKTLDLYIYDYVEGDGYNWATGEPEQSETSGKAIRDKLAEAVGVTQINVYINSCGGSVKEGLAIYNQLQRHPAAITVYVDGFALSIASVIAMAGDRVVMAANALMMIHHAATIVMGNPADLRKAADDLEIIDGASNSGYLAKAGAKLTQEKLTELLDAETWLNAAQCLEYGLADEIAGTPETATIAAAKQRLAQAMQAEIQQTEPAVIVPDEFIAQKTNAEKLMAAFGKKMEEKV